MEINKGIEAFDDRTDFTRGNKDRLPWGKSQSATALDISGEYAALAPPEKTPEPVATPVVQPSGEKKLTHKLGNGTILEAATVEELAALIEKSLQAPPAPLEFEDEPLYKPVEYKRRELTVQEKATILNLLHGDNADPQKAMRMLQEAEFGAPVETILQNLSASEQRELNRRQEIAGVEFIAECEDYNPTRTNAKKLTDYLREKGKPITKQNLVLSFQQLVAAGDKNLLRKVEPGVITPQSTEPELSEVPEPPVVVPSNQGRPELAAPGQVDVAKFATLSLADMQKEFAKLRRRA